MRLRNKKTGKIEKLVGYVKTGDDRMFFRFEDDIDTYKKEYNSLAELNAEWEDVPEEPKEHYFITEYGEVFSLNEYEGLNNVANPEDYEAIGNYFDTREEAEKAVEKLKAWKRLKDKGFVFDKWCNDNRKYLGDFVIYAHTKDLTDIVDDLDLLFGGEE